MKLFINNKRYNFFSNWNITLNYNAIANTFSFDGKRDVLNYILDYPECKIYDDNDDLLITGTILSPAYKLSTTPEFYKYAGYGLAGILDDCSIPIELFPLQYDNLSLLQITEKLLDPFNLKYNFTSNVLNDLNKKFEKITTEPGTAVKTLINNLASQRNVYLTNNAFGEIEFTRYEPSKYLPAAYFVEGKLGIENINLNIASQALHSQITIVKQASKNNVDAGEYTINNPYVEKYRPIVKVLNSGDIFDVKKAARNALSAELSNIKISFDTTVFEKPGTTISLVAPSIGINNPTELFIEQTIIKGTTSRNDKYSFICVLPDVYTNNEVKNIFK